MTGGQRRTPPTRVGPFSTGEGTDLLCLVVPIRWFPSGSNPAQYKHVVTCGPPPSSDAEDFCHPENLPCLFNGSAASLSVRLLQKPHFKLAGFFVRLLQKNTKLEACRHEAHRRRCTQS